MVSGTVDAVVFDLQVSERAGWTVLAVVGELDLANAPKVRQSVIHVLGTAAPGGDGQVPRRLVIDLTGVDFLDSSGLGVLIGAHRRVRAAGGELRLVANDQRIRDLFRETDLDRVFTVCPTVDDAVHGPAGDAPLAGGLDG